MLTLKCSACRRKLWKYQKLGKGAVLRCHKDRIVKRYQVQEREGKIFCACGQPVGIDKGDHFSMDRKTFTYSGLKVSKLK